MAAGGSGTPVDHLLTHDVVESWILKTQQASLWEIMLKISLCNIILYLHCRYKIAIINIIIGKAACKCILSGMSNIQEYINHKYIHSG